MKKIWLLLLVVVLSAGLAGCPGGDKDADPVGQWVVYVDFGCNGSVDNSGVWHFYANRTFIDSYADTGTWSVHKKDITLNYNDGSIWGGEVDGDRMSGTYSYGTTSGCFTAQRTSNLP